MPRAAVAFQCFSLASRMMPHPQKVAMYSSSELKTGVSIPKVSSTTRACGAMQTLAVAFSSESRPWSNGNELPGLPGLPLKTVPGLLANLLVLYSFISFCGCYRFLVPYRKAFLSRAHSAQPKGKADLHLAWT